MDLFYLPLAFGMPLLWGGILLMYISLSYGIQLLARKYEPDIHPIVSWLPFFNLYPYLRVARWSSWWMLLLVLIFVSIIPLPGMHLVRMMCVMVCFCCAIFLHYSVAQRAGKGIGTVIGLILFPTIALLWLGLRVHAKNTFIAYFVGIIGIIAYLYGSFLFGFQMRTGDILTNPTIQKAIQNARNNPAIQKEIQELSNNPELQKNIQEYINNNPTIEAALKQVVQ